MFILPHMSLLPILLSAFMLMALTLAFEQVHQTFQSAGKQDENIVSYDSATMPASQTATQRQRAIQQKSITDFYQKYNLSEGLSEFSFQTSQNFEQFHFDLASDQVISFVIRVHTLRDNVYSQIENIEKEAALQVAVFQNNNRIQEKSLFFSDVVVIDGKKESSYIIRFSSQTHKLVIVNHNKFIAKAHFDNVIVSDRMKDFDEKLSSTKNKLSYIFKVLKSTYRIEFEERSLINTKTKTFSDFEMFEISILIGLCFLQIRLVSRLFKNDSIV